MDRLDGRVAVVTGAGNGIGRALASQLVAEGMSVVLADIETDSIADAAAKLEADGGVALPVRTDVSDPDSVAALAEAALSRFGAVHVLCNNAAVVGQFSRTWTASLAEWRWLLDVNVMGVVHGIQTFVPILLEQDEAHIVNTGSAACFEALPGMGLYAATKHAVLGLSEALARELSARGANVGVSVIMPGGVARSSIMTGTRNFIDRYGDLPDADADPLPSMIRAGFTHAVDNGVEPEVLARAAVEGIRSNAYLVCDDAELLSTWSSHHVSQATGERPVWPPPAT